MSRVARLYVVLVMNLALIGALVTVGLAAHSLGVLAAGGDYLVDAAAIAVSLLAIWLSRRPTAHRKATTLAALVNGGWLLVLSLIVALGAGYRLLTRPPRVEGLPVLVVSAIASVVMMVGAVVLGGDTDDDDDGDSLNMRAVLLDTAADAAAAAGVAITGGIIYATGHWFWLDSAVALAIAVVVGYHALRLIVKALRSLRRQAPTPPSSSASVE